MKIGLTIVDINGELSKETTVSIYDKISREPYGVVRLVSTKDKIGKTLLSTKAEYYNGVEDDLFPITVDCGFVNELLSYYNGSVSDLTNLFGSVIVLQLVKFSIYNIVKMSSGETGNIGITLDDDYEKLLAETIIEHLGGGCKEGFELDLGIIKISNDAGNFIKMYDPDNMYNLGVTKYKDTILIGNNKFDFYFMHATNSVFIVRDKLQVYIVDMFNERVGEMLNGYTNNLLKHSDIVTNKKLQFDVVFEDLLHIILFNRFGTLKNLQ